MRTKKREKYYFYRKMFFVRFWIRKYPIKTFKQPSTVSFILHRRKINLFRSLGLIWLVTFRATGSRVIKWIIWSNIGVSLIWISWVQILHCSIKSIISCSGTWRYLLHKNSTFSLSCSKIGFKLVRFDFCSKTYFWIFNSRTFSC